MVFNVPESEERNTITAADLPYSVVELSNVPVPLKDGKKLFAHIWIPQESFEGKLRVGTLVEYLPYRKNDFTAIRDSIRHPYYAGFGFASMRVDMRGCGDSDDELHGEYLLQEQEDNLQVFDWITSQPWSNEKIGQFGKSWGGFNGLQIAARQHPALKTIITLCSTDDRYADDVHYRGGCLLASDMLWWASTMLAYNARPQDPDVRPEWRENWNKRLRLEPNVVEWVKHQTRDEFWKHGSVCEDYNSVDIPVLAVGGWRDGYTNAIFRLLNNLPNKESKGIIGPWVHEYPEVATPSPGLGYNQIAVKWFSKYLTTEESILDNINTTLNVSDDFDIEKLSHLTAYLQDPCSLEAAYTARSGSWIGRNSANADKYKNFWFDAATKSLASKQPAESSVSFTGTQEHGLFRGSWCPFGQAGDFPSDQKIEDSKCITFDTHVEDDYALLGFPVADLYLSSDCELANISVRLVDIDPVSNENCLISWGVGNLSHFVGNHEYPEKLEPGKKYHISLKLDAVGYNLKKGHILRVALSPTDWPSVWPLPVTPTLTLYGKSSIQLPLITAKEETYLERFFPKPESLAPCEREIIREDSRTRKVVYDVVKNHWTIDDFSDEGKRLIVKNGVEMGSWNKNIWSIDPKDPLSAYNQCDWELTLGRGESWQIRLVTTSSMRSDKHNYLLKNKLVAYYNDDLVFNNVWENAIPRNFT